MLFYSTEIFSGSEPQPIKLGFVGTLTGRLSDLGTAGRNAVILAVEEVNSEGGINGRQVLLLTRDDMNDPERAVQIDRELIEEGVAAIIGHMTSSMSMAAVSLINSKKMVMISPTTSTDELTGTDDYFFRTTLASITQTDNLSEFIAIQMDLKRIAVIYDLSNRAFSERLYNNFKDSYEKLGGEVAYVQTFTSGEPESFFILAKRLLSVEPECVFIIAGAIDAALICQQIRKIDVDVPIVSSAWAMTPDLIKNGGPTVEGIIFSQTINNESRNEAFLSFNDAYRNRFGNEPSFAAIYAYESAQVIIKALSIDDSPEKLKDTIINNDVYHGLQGDLRIDRFGDARRKRYIKTIKNGRFRILE
ncbi:Leucine-, isoleucine-, valine-, threonine-, and alanine-binding protein [subsurface metagenome]